MNNFMTVSGTNETKTMSSLEIAELTGKRHDHILRDVRKMLDDLEINSPQIWGQYKDPINRDLLCANLNQELTMTLVAGYSTKLRNAVVKRWMELESTGQQTYIETDLDRNLKYAAFLKTNLNMSESSFLGITHKIEKKYSLIAMAPSYAIDAPTGATATSSEPTVSLTTLLQGSGISVQKANKALIKSGLLEQLTRPSIRSGVDKVYKAITAKGLLYGKNIVSPTNPREVQPHWYLSMKEELFKIIINNMD